MYFNIDADTGLTVTGWLVMENVTLTPEFVVTFPDRESVSLKANVFRSDLVHHGIHATGMAGFQFDAHIIPDIEMADFTICEASTGHPIYRRRDPKKHFAKKVMFLEVAAMPQIGMLRNLMANFALRYPFLERQTLDTINATITHNFSDSIFVYGHLNWLRHGGYARERDFTTIALLRDPYEELAERLLLIQNLCRQNNSSSRLRDQLNRFGELSAAISEMDLQSPKSILSGFRRLNPLQRRILRSPMTAALGCAPEEEVNRRHVSVALDNLADISVVGSRRLFPTFSKVVAGYLGAAGFQEVGLDTLPGTLQLAKDLSDIGLVGDLLDEDIALYNFVNEALVETNNAYENHVTRN